MNISVFEFTSVGYLSDGAYNLINDLRNNSIYLSGIGVINSVDELKNKVSTSDLSVVYLGEKDYHFLKKSLKEYLVNGDSFLINGYKTYLISSTVNYYDNLSLIINEFKNNFNTYKLYGADMVELDNYLYDKNIFYKIYTDGQDVKINFDFSPLSEDERWEFLKNFNLKFSEYIYAESDVTLEGQLVKILSIRNLKISVAESFTAGALASTITSISGSSKVFYEGVVAYNENSKRRRLGVLDKTLKFKRAVSGDTCYEMCLGLLNEGVDLAVSTTGIAGPNSDESGFPVGLAYIGVGTKKKIVVYKFNFDGTRRDITNKGVKQAIFMAIKALRNGSFDI